MSDYFSLLPEHLKETAYRASREEAWARKQAIEVVDVISERGICVLGGEIWLPTQPGPTLPSQFIYEWDVGSKLASEDWMHFVGRAMGISRDYIRAFRWTETDRHAHEEPYFNLSLCSASRYQELELLKQQLLEKEARRAERNK